jgi:hypothetical protein
MPKVNFYHRYSDLDEVHEFGVTDGGCGEVYLTWVFFYLGVYLGREYKTKIRLFPYKVYSWENPIKTYKINDAEKCAQLITQRIKKILNNSQIVL